MKTYQEAYSEAYSAAVEADNDWSNELFKAFGNAAGDRRYDINKANHPEPCKKAYRKWRAAQDTLDGLKGNDYPPHADF